MTYYTNIIPVKSFAFKCIRNTFTHDVRRTIDICIQISAVFVAAKMWICIHASEYLGPFSTYCFKLPHRSLFIVPDARIRYT